MLNVVCRRPVVAAVIMLAVFVLASTHVARGAAGGSARPALSEAQAKAMFLLSLARFVHWPAHRDGGPLVVGVLFNDDLIAALDAVTTGRTAGGRPVVVRRLSPSDSFERCHILVVSATNGRLESDALRRAGAAVLTVGERADFLRQGGMVRFYIDEGRIRFQVNADAAERDGLKLSSQLLSLAAS